jgi:WD40 repeat protein/tRNA A-37 threonylcarbamoyl transferase component Bud32
MSDDKPTRPLAEGEDPTPDPSSLKGLTMALGIEPAKPGHDPLLGSDIGGVTIVRLIAEGGMGRVYEGKQEKPNRTVAVKVMRPGLTSPSILKRFEYEAEVLGRLQHPGIAHIYSVGVHRMGNASVPYFVMEYIANARTLTQYATDLKLPTRQRLDLFRSVCDAVSHGHQKGVIHRDLKPTNILVDATGQPKVIDFGVARATDSDMALTTMQTDVGQLIGTLQYMSPEQFDADPNDIDIRSDVYALGVILYELLAEKLPYDVKKKALYEVMRIVKEEDPTPLSSFNRALRGDVAVIAGKCLEKDRGRRYSSASEVGADIGRYLTGDPISASPPGFVDGLLRLAKKHRAAATAVAGVFGSLVLAVVGITVFAARAEKARQVALEERDRANANEQEARRQTLVAETATQEAVSAKEAALEDQKRASRETDNAKRRLYVANLYRLNMLIDQYHCTAARGLIEETQALLSLPRVPIDLRLAKSRMETARRVLPGKAIRLAYSPSGESIAVSGAESLQIWDPNLLTAQSMADALKLKFPYHYAMTAMVFNTQGSLLAAATGEYAVEPIARIWDLRSGRAVASLRGHSSSLTAVAFSRDGTRLITASADATARLWDTATWTEVAVLKGHKYSVNDACFSPDGSQVVTVSGDSMPRLWNGRTGQSIKVFEGSQDSFHKVAWSPAGDRIATDSGADATPHLWDATTGKEVCLLKGHLPTRSVCQIYAIAFSPNSELLATASSDNTARVWDARTGDIVAVCNGHTLDVHGVAFNPTGDRLLTWSTDNTSRLWDPKTGEMQRVFPCPSPGDVAFSKDGKTLAATGRDGAVRLWDAGEQSDPSTLRRVDTRPECVAFSEDKSRLAMTTTAGTIEILDLGAMRRFSIARKTDEPISDLAWSANGAHIVALGRTGNVYVWDTVFGSYAQAHAGQGDLRVGRIAISPDGAFALASSDRGRVLLNLKTGRKIADLKNASAGGLSPLRHTAAFTTDGSRVVTSDPTGGDLRVWSTMTGEMLAESEERDGGIASLAINRAGTRVATASFRRRARVYDLETAKLVSETREHLFPVSDVVFSPDGSRVASADMADAGGKVLIWDAATGETIVSVGGASGGVPTLCFNPEGTRLLTASTSGVMRLWDTETGAELSVMKGHVGGVWWAGFAKAGDVVVSASEDKTLRVWGLSNEEIWDARARAGEAEERLGPIVDTWFSGGRNSVVRGLQTAKKTMSPDEFSAAAGLVLRRGAMQGVETQ